MTIIREYMNGNCLVKIYSDGTKVRSCDGEPHPVWPESIDLKITDQCKEGCEWCHESCTPTGEHANYADMLSLLMTLPQGIEIAIGGGDPLLHPLLLDTVKMIHGLGLIPNLSVNFESFMRNMELFKVVQEYCWGIGMSVDGLDIVDQIVNDDKFVYHAIAGIHSPMCLKRDKKFLVLGYKKYGRGEKYYNDEVKHNLRHWRSLVPALLERKHPTALDNLALEQLNIRKYAGEKLWQERFMGDDGQFTMYIDAVKMEYAKSSTGDRFPCEKMSIQQMFASLRK